MKTKKKPEPMMQKSWMMSTLERLSEQSPDHPLVIDCEVYSRVRTLSSCKCVAGFLAAHGIERGMRVLFDIDLTFSWRVIVCWCACQCIGAVSFFWPPDMRFRHEVDEMKASDALNGGPTMVLLGTRGRAEQWQKADRENGVSGRILVDLTGACGEMDGVLSWDAVIAGEPLAPRECPDEATMVYTQGSHEFERPVVLSLSHLRDASEDLQAAFQWHSESRLWADLIIANSVNLSLFAACLHSGAVWVCHEKDASLEVMRDAGITHAFLLPSTLSGLIEQIRKPGGASAWTKKWRELSLGFCRLRAKRKTVFAGAIRSGCMQPIQKACFPSLQAVISYGNHFEADTGEFFSYLEIPIYNAYTMGELGIVHLHAFMGKGGFLKCVDARIKSGILAVKSKRSCRFVDTGDFVFEDERCGLCSKRSFVIRLDSGCEVDVSPMREILRREALIDEVFIFGEDKPYLTGLIYLNEKELYRFAAENKLEGEFDVLARDALVYRHVRAIVDRCNLRRSSNESIQKIAILTCPLTRDPRILTPCGLTRRVDVERRYAKMLEGFYRENF